MTKKKFQLLDCTFRDGGYYNNWNFSKAVVNSYVNFINNSRIEYVEIGFRFFKNAKYAGPFACIKDEQIKKIKFNPNIKLGIMINAADIIELSKKNSLEKVTEFFLKKKTESNLTFVRIAVHFHEIEKVLCFVKQAKIYGYQVMLNIMQASEKKIIIFKKIFTNIKKINSVDVLYFADSLGCMNPGEIKKVCNYFKKYWKKDFGFHAHDNKGKALINTLVAKENGAKWLDGTVQGMGRGAGNVKTESLLLEFYKNVLSKKEFLEILKISQNTFYNLKQKYHWGYSPYYHLAANNKIHPTYTQSILEESKYTNEEVVNLLSNLKKVKASSFDKTYLNKLTLEFNKNDNSKKIDDWALNKNILIISQGSFFLENKNKIVEFIKYNKPIVLSLNLNKEIPSKFINYYIASNQDRVILDFNQYKKLNKTLVIPEGNFKKLGLLKKSRNILNYGLKKTSKSLYAYSDHCETFSDLVLSYALCFSAIGRPKNIFLGGFDGYEDILKNKINQDIFTKFKKNYPSISMKPITKSVYKF